MTAFFDTSVLIRLFLQEPPQHDASRLAFDAHAPSDRICAAHSLAEVFSVLTRLPVHPQVPSEAATAFVMEIERHAQVVSLEPDEYRDAILHYADRGIRGGTIYDALLAACARKTGAQVFYTWNLKHFRLLLPELGEQVRTP